MQGATSFLFCLLSKRLDTEKPLSNLYHHLHIDTCVDTSDQCGHNAPPTNFGCGRALSITVHPHFVSSVFTPYIKTDGGWVQRGPLKVELPHTKFKFLLK